MVPSKMMEALRCENCLKTFRARRAAAKQRSAERIHVQHVEYTYSQSSRQAGRQASGHGKQASRHAGTQARRHACVNEHESIRCIPVMSQAAGQAGSQAGRQACKQPGRQACKQPGIQIARQPGSQIARQPATQPARRPAQGAAGEAGLRSPESPGGNVHQL